MVNSFTLVLSINHMSALPLSLDFASWRNCNSWDDL